MTNEDDKPVATGYLNLEANSVDAIFTLPQYTGCGAAGLLDAIKAEAKSEILKIGIRFIPECGTFLSETWIY